MMKNKKTKPARPQPLQPSTKAPAFGLDLKGTFGLIPASTLKGSTAMSPLPKTKTDPGPSPAAPVADAAGTLPPATPAPPQAEAVIAAPDAPDEDVHADWAGIDPALMPDGPPVAFPLDILDDTSAAFVRDTARAVGVSQGAVALPFLTAAGAAIGNAVLAEGLPGWTQPPILNTLLFGQPSINKSGAMKGGVGPVQAVEDLERAEHAAHYGPPATGKPKRASAAREMYRRATEEFDPDAPGLAATGPVPPMPQLICGRTSLPGFENIAMDNPKGQLVVLDEAVPFLDEKSDFRQATLTAFNAETHKRATANKLVDIANMGFSFVGGIQPAKLQPLFASLNADGLGARLLPVVCGHVDIARVTERVDQAPVVATMRILRDIPCLQTPGGGLQPQVVPFTREAGDLIHDRRVAAADQMADEDGIMAGFIGKGHGTVVRLALILAFLDAAAQGLPLPAEVGAGPVERAGRLFDSFLLPMARMVFGPETDAPIVKEARDLVAVLRRLKAPYVSERDLLRAKGQKLRRKSELAPVVVYLIEEGILRFVEGTSTGGRPSDGFDVNPRLWS